MPKNKLKNTSINITKIMIVIVNLFLDISLSIFLYERREIKKSINDSAMSGMNTTIPAM